MLNIEKYKNKLIELGVIDIDNLALKDGIPYRCNGNSCDDCDFKNSEKGCYIRGCTDWLFSEYKGLEVDWSKVKVDTQIYVRDNENSPWLPRHFARYENGKVYVWYGGSTSFTENEDFSYNYAKLAESEEQI